MQDHDKTKSQLIAELAALRARVADLELAQQSQPSSGALDWPPVDGQAAPPAPCMELAFDHNPCPMWIFDAESLEFLAVNDAAVRHYGYTREELRAMRLTDLCPKEDRPALRQWLTLAQFGQSISTATWRYRTKDGRLVDVDAVSREIEFDRRAAMLVLVNDITQRRRMEQVVEGQRYFFELLATGAPLQHVLGELIRTVELQLDGAIGSILLLEEDGRRVRHCASSSLPETYIRAIDGAEIGPHAGSCGSAAYRNETVVVEDIASDPLWADYRDVALAHGLRACWSVPFCDSQGRALGTFGIYYRRPLRPTPRNLADLKNAAYLAAVAVERTRAEDDLRASEQRYRLASQAISDVIWEWDAVAGTLHWSDCAETVFGYTQDQIGEPPTWWDERLHPDDSARVQGGLNAVIDGGSQFWSDEYRFRRADGSYADILDRAYVVRDASGGVLRMIGAMQDITERKRAEAEIYRLNQDLERRVAERTVQLEALNKELEAFSYSVSHDLRAPLRHIDGFARLLAEREGGRLDETSRRYLQIVGDSARRMGQLIDDLLSFSRMGRAEMQSQPLDLNQLVASVRSDLAPLCEGRRVVWEIGQLPGVRGDRALIRVVLVNLLSNAVKYTAPREEAHIAVVAGDAGVDECVVTIRDNGVGFDMQYAHKLFGVFQRLHRDDEFEGTGIGLATVRRIISRHGGRVWAEGQPDAGAAFHFTLKRLWQEQ